jgi:hypothetical protein
VNHVSSLGIIPPPQRFHIHPIPTDGGLGLFDLNLKSTMGEKKGVGMIDQYFHNPIIQWTQSAATPFLRRSRARAMLNRRVGPPKRPFKPEASADAGFNG